MFLDRLMQYKLFLSSPSAAVLPGSVEYAMSDPVGGLILASPPPPSEERDVLIQFFSNGLSLQASKINTLTSSDLSVKNRIIV